MKLMDELRVTLTVDDFDRALAFYRDALGLRQLEDWSSEDGRVILLEAGHATLELFDHAQAAHIDQIEVGSRSPARCGCACRSPTATVPPSISSRAVRQGRRQLWTHLGETATPGSKPPTACN